MIKRTTRSLLLSLAASALISGCLTTSVSAAPSLSVDGTPFPGRTQLQESTTYVPMREFLTFLGWDVQWDEASRSATAEKDDRSLAVHMHDQTLTVQEQTKEVALSVQSGRIYLPLRSLCTLLGYDVFWDKETKSVSVTDSEEPFWSEEDLYWLSRIICAEAGGESMEGQIAVGNVVLNRVASDEFPNTIYDVIFDKKDAVQFEPVSNGTIYNPPTAASIEAAKAALRGTDIVGDSLFFFNPSLSSGSWTVNHRTYYTTIGCHQFYL